LYPFEQMRKVSTNPDVPICESRYFQEIQVFPHGLH
jgi:hypothetical protein